MRTKQSGPVQILYPQSSPVRLVRSKKYTQPLLGICHAIINILIEMFKQFQPFIHIKELKFGLRIKTHSSVSAAKKTKEDVRHKCVIY